MAHNVFSVGPNEDDIRYDKNNDNYKVPSKAYVDALVKKLADETRKHTPNLDTTLVELSLVEKEEEMIPAERIRTDSTHKFVSDALIQIFRDKVSTQELKAIVTDLTNNFTIEINNQFNRILNTPNSVQLLRDISSVISEDNTLKSIMGTLAGKADIGDLNLHKEDSTHLTNSDRKALNLLLSFITTGCADWDASPDAPNYIRNKPTSLPANGGNADTVGGYTIDDLKAGNKYNCVYGLNGYNRIYDECDVDTIITKDNTALVMRNLYGLQPGEYLFRTGLYNWTDLKLSKHRVSTAGSSVISGVGNSTVFKASKVTISNEITLKDLKFTNSEIIVDGSNVIFDNVEFNNCKVTFKDTTDLTVRNCKASKSSFLMVGRNLYTMVVHNKFINCELGFYRSTTNCIENNIIA